jgi:hypothetical protein
VVTLAGWHDSAIAPKITQNLTGDPGIVISTSVIGHLSNELITAGTSIQSQEGTEECLTKPGGKVAASSWGLAWAQSGPYPKPWARPKKINRGWNPWMGI